MRIQILSQYYAPEIGAPQVRHKAITKELVRRGHQVDVVTAMPNYPTGRIWDGYRRKLIVREDRDGADVRRVWIHAATGSGLGRIVNYLSFAAMALIGMARTKRPTITIVESPPLFAVLPTLVDRLLRRRRYVLLISDLWPDTAIEMGMVSSRLAQRALFVLERLAYRFATVVAPVTEGIVDTLREAKRVPEAKICLLKNGVDLDLFDDSEPRQSVVNLLVPHGERVIMFAGTLGYAQGLDVIIDAIAPVRSVCPDARFVFVGSGSDEARVRARIFNEGIEGVVMLDPRPLEEVVEMYKVVTAGITSLLDSPVFEGARPSKIFPMMAAGLPILYSGRGEGARIVSDADAGLCVEPEDPTALANAIVRLLGDPERAREMGRNGRRLVEAEFSWRSIVGNFLDELERRVN